MSVPLHCYSLTPPCTHCSSIYIYTIIYRPWSCPNALSTRSVKCSIIAPVKQPTTSSPSLAAMTRSTKVLHVVASMRDEEY